MGAVMLADYFFVRRTQLSLKDLFLQDGLYTYSRGFNLNGMFALFAGILVAMIGYYVPALQWLYSMAWFTGCFVSMLIYVVLMRVSK